MNAVVQFGAGYRTYIIAAVLVIGVVSAIDARQTARADAMRDRRDFRE